MFCTSGSRSAPKNAFEPSGWRLFLRAAGALRGSAPAARAVRFFRGGSTRALDGIEERSASKVLE